MAVRRPNPRTDGRRSRSADRHLLWIAVGRGYAVGMKTAVSIPDDIFERAERLARRSRRSRSEVYAAALDEYVARHAPDEVTDTMNRVCEEIGNDEDTFLAAAGRYAPKRVEW